ncbi:proline-rich receptor-like protein kinase PERK10 [Megalops cyprinoides]|uniref:proline-rich receptor-like protein kinase PERK10 n=1 Tax=Megalops cyprinoides TaxID=118141 RepID=UPI001864ED79|nr:proline-rich receptor-like protein kinase PERK10 [Megalops cyprinoides]
MERLFCQLVFVLWVLPFDSTGQVTMSSASSDPPKNESPRSTLGESRASVTMGLDNLNHPTASERENFTTLSSMGNGSAPSEGPKAPVKKPTTANDLSASAEGVPHHLETSMITSPKRIMRNTGPVQGELNTTLRSDPEVHSETTGNLTMSVSPTDQPDPKVSPGAHEKLTPPRLAQTSLEEQSNTTPQQAPQSVVTSSTGPLTVQHTTLAKPAGSLTRMPTTAINQETMAHSGQPPPTESTPTSVSPSQDHRTSTHMGSTQPAPEVKPSTSPTSTITTSKHTLPPKSTGAATATTSTANVTVSQTPLTTGNPVPTPTPKKPSEPPTTTSTTTRRQPPPATKPKEQKQSGAGRAVGIIVGMTLILMLLAIVFILLRKRRTQRRQLNDPTWAGPSPFLDGGAQPQLPAGDDEGGDLLKDSKRISLVGILPRRLSKRLSLLKESDEEVLMGEIPSGSTFGRVQDEEIKSGNGSLLEQGQNKNQNQNPGNDNTKGGAVEGSMAPAAPAPLEDVSLGLPPAEVVTTPPPPQLDEQHPAPPLVLLDVDLGPPAGETAVPPPPPCEDSFVAPPAPPLPSSAS